MRETRSAESHQAGVQSSSDLVSQSSDRFHEHRVQDRGDMEFDSSVSKWLETPTIQSLGRCRGIVLLIPSVLIFCHPVTLKMVHEHIRNVAACKAA